MPRKLTEKPYNNGTMTRAAFFALIRSGLRQKSRWWKPLQQAKINARRPSKNKNKRLKWEFKCAECKKWFPDKETVVDHIIPCGELNSFEDLPKFAERLFCEIEGFQILCRPCHKIKTLQEMNERKSKQKD